MSGDINRPTQHQQISILIERVSAVQCDTSEIKKKLETMQKEQTDFRISYEVKHAEVVEDIRSNSARLDDHDESLEKLESVIEEIKKAVQPLIFQSKFLGWLGGILGVSALTLIWMIITQQVTLVVP